MTYNIPAYPYNASQEEIAPKRYWVGGSGTWSETATTHWSATSGGVGGASVPTKMTDVVFDSNSFSADNQTVLLSNAIDDYSHQVRSLDCSGINRNNTKIKSVKYYDSSAFGYIYTNLEVRYNITLSPKLNFDEFDATLVIGYDNAGVPYMGDRSGYNTYTGYIPSTSSKNGVPVSEDRYYVFNPNGALLPNVKLGISAYSKWRITGDLVFRNWSTSSGCDFNLSVHVPYESYYSAFDLRGFSIYARNIYSSIMNYEDKYYYFFRGGTTNSLHVTHNCKLPRITLNIGETAPDIFKVGTEVLVPGAYSQDTFEIVFGTKAGYVEAFGTVRVRNAVTVKLMPGAKFVGQTDGDHLIDHFIAIGTSEAKIIITSNSLQNNQARFTFEDADIQYCVISKVTVQSVGIINAFNSIDSGNVDGIIFALPDVTRNIDVPLMSALASALNSHTVFGEKRVDGNLFFEPFVLNMCFSKVTIPVNARAYLDSTQVAKATARAHTEYSEAVDIPITIAEVYAEMGAFHYADVRVVTIGNIYVDVLEAFGEALSPTLKTSNYLSVTSMTSIAEALEPRVEVVYFVGGIIKIVIAKATASMLSPTYFAETKDYPDIIWRDKTTSLSAEYSVESNISGLIGTFIGGDRSIKLSGKVK